MAVAAVADDFFCEATAGVSAAFFAGFAPVEAVPDAEAALAFVVLFLSAVAFVVLDVFSVFAEPLVDFSLAIVSVPCLDVEDDNGAGAGVCFVAAVFFAAVPVVFFAAVPAVFFVVPVFRAGTADVPAAFGSVFFVVPAVRAPEPVFVAVAPAFFFAGAAVVFFAVVPAAAFFFAGAAAFAAAGFTAAAFFPVVLPAGATDADGFDVFTAGAGFVGLAGAALFAVFRLPAATVAFFAVDAFAMKILLKKPWRTINLHNIGESLLKFYS